jgi:hypothetical protein
MWPQQGDSPIAQARLSSDRPARAKTAETIVARNGAAVRAERACNLSAQVLDGDFPKGSKIITPKNSISIVHQGTTESLNGKIWAIIQVLSERTKPGIGGSLGVGFALGSAESPPGVLAGGAKTVVCFICRLTDGRCFTAETDLKTFELFAAAAALSQQRRQQQLFEEQRRQEELLEKEQTLPIGEVGGEEQTHQTNLRQ